MKDYYVYIYLNPLKNKEPFYVGKTRKKRRHIEHFSESITSTCNPHKFYTIQKIKKETGNKPLIEIYASNLTNEEACFLEEELIAFYGRSDIGTGILTNMTNGGEGLSRKMPEEIKRKIGITNSKKSLETIEKIRQANLGRKASPETIEKQRISHLGKKLSEEQKIKIGLSNIGKHNIPRSKNYIPWNKGKKYKNGPNKKTANQIEELNL